LSPLSSAPPCPSDLRPCGASRSHDEERCTRCGAPPEAQVGAWIEDNERDEPAEHCGACGASRKETHNGR
jgi:hypothetical protein